MKVRQNASGQLCSLNAFSRMPYFEFLSSTLMDPLSMFKAKFASALIAVMACAGCAVPHQHAHTSARGPQSAALDVTTINGERVPGQMARLINVKKMMETVDVNGNRMVVERGVRKAGTRVGIHVHEYGGHTCVLSGEITDFMDGHAPTKWPAGSCYYMPPNLLMSAVNLGAEDAVLVDTFILPPGAPLITIREPGYPSE